MPHDDPDREDPQELVGVLVPEGDEGEMARTFIEEFVRMGASDEDLWRMFRSPFYAGMNGILRRRGEPYVTTVIEEVRAQWGYWRAGR
ncbi:MAG: hypothetical protein ACRD3M_07330 [Thermoanaerobaculia bacterium]